MAPPLVEGCGFYLRANGGHLKSCEAWGKRVSDLFDGQIAPSCNFILA
jgi:hypothetical protein